MTESFRDLSAQARRSWSDETLRVYEAAAETFRAEGRPYRPRLQSARARPTQRVTAGRNQPHRKRRGQPDSRHAGTPRYCPRPHARASATSDEGIDHVNRRQYGGLSDRARRTGTPPGWLWSPSHWLLPRSSTTTPPVVVPSTLITSVWSSASASARPACIEAARRARERRAREVPPQEAEAARPRRRTLPGLLRSPRAAVQ